MNKLVSVTFLLLQSIAVGSAAAAPYYTKAESSASESSGPDGVVRTVTNTSFAFTSLYSPQKQNYTDGLLAQKVEIISVSGKDGVSPKIEVTAWAGGKAKYDTKIWTINDCADSGWQSGDFYWTSKYGGSNAENLLRAYNLKTGKYLFSFTTAPVSVDIYIPKDVIKRNIAYLSKKGVDSECRKNDLPRNAIGALTLSDGDKQIDRVVLLSDDENLTQSPKILLVNDRESKGVSNLSIWGPADFVNKGDIVKGFSVKISFVNGKEVVIPVNNDKFDIQKATFPESVKIQYINVEKTYADKF